MREKNIALNKCYGLGQIRIRIVMESVEMTNIRRKIGISILGLLQGTLGSYFALLGFAFAFPESGPGSKDYEEDIFFVPFGYIIMFIWLALMIIAFIRLRKNKGKLLLFSISWFIGICIFLIYGLFIY